eukprot:TRINITY_DN2894_c15_g1_i1.p1 TRINITY_DN2894_c15_g1~~TRINITY_DN2894_c15_g1_i1.p1  ORF type:complete len:122 (-),score=6.12 TRINITY_DN2894_c15_g1_i1:104-445(-)
MHQKLQKMEFNLEHINLDHLKKSKLKSSKLKTFQIKVFYSITQNFSRKWPLGGVVSEKFPSKNFDNGFEHRLVHSFSNVWRAWKNVKQIFLFLGLFLVILKGFTKKRYSSIHK